MMEERFLLDKLARELVSKEDKLILEEYKPLFKKLSYIAVREHKKETQEIFEKLEKTNWINPVVVESKKYRKWKSRLGVGKKGE